MRAPQAASVLVLASMVGGCSLSADTSLAEKQVAQFHASLDQGRIAEMYARASQEMKTGTPEPDFVTFLEAVHRKLGTMRKTEMVHWKFDNAPPGTLVTLTYRTQYAGGEATEEFDYRIKDGAALLVRYNIKSNALITKRPDPGYVPIGPDPLPSASYEHPPAVAFERSDYAIKLQQMGSFYDVPGEAGSFIDGEDYGFTSLSVIMTETQPHGGPPLHTHDTEEAHIVFRGQVEYLIGDRRFTVDGPYIVRVPAGVPHTFMNAGTEPLNMTAVFPSKRITYTEKGPNPLVQSAAR